MKSRIVTFRASLAAGALIAGISTPAYADTALLLCAAANGTFEWTVDFDRKTVSSASEGAPYTVPAIITDRTISWDAPSSTPGTHYPTEIDRMTATYHRSVCTPEGGCTTDNVSRSCHKGQQQF